MYAVWQHLGGPTQGGPDPASLLFTNKIAVGQENIRDLKSIAKLALKNCKSIGKVGRIEFLAPAMACRCREPRRRAAVGRGTQHPLGQLALRIRAADVVLEAREQRSGCCELLPADACAPRKSSAANFTRDANHFDVRGLTHVAFGGTSV